MGDLKQPVLGSYAVAAMVTDKAFEGFDQSSAFVKPDTGGNHAAWIAGHLAVACDGVLAEFGQDKALGEQYYKLFDQGTEPTDDPSQYPPYEELVASMKTSRQALLDWFEGLSEEEAGADLKPEWQAFGKTVAGMVASLGVHENFHAGQLSVVRKKLGMSRLFG